MNIWCAVTPKGSDEIGKPHFSACTSFLYATWRARHCGTFCTLQWFDPLFEGCLLLRLPSRCYLVAETGLEPVTFSLWSCLAAVATLRVAPPAGFEPATLRFTAECSAVELKGNVDGRAFDPIWTDDLLITSELLCQLSYESICFISWCIW